MSINHKELTMIEKTKIKITLTGEKDREYSGTFFDIANAKRFELEIQKLEKSLNGDLFPADDGEARNDE